MLVRLATDDNSGVVWGAANGLGLIKSRRATRSLMRFARISKVEAHRHAAMAALGSIGDPRAEQCLLSTLLNQNESEAMRQWAAEALKGAHRRGRGTSALVQALRDPSASVRWSVLTTLGCIGDRSALESVREYLSDQAVVPGLDPEEATVAFAAAVAVDNLTRIAVPTPRRVPSASKSGGKE
jgi:HEAT repeat protein